MAVVPLLSTFYLNSGIIHDILGIRVSPASGSSPAAGLEGIEVNSPLYYHAALVWADAAGT